MGRTELEAARSRAQTLFGKGNKQEKGKDEEFFRARDEERQKEAAKMARLRALRLEKEAKEKAEKDGADKKPATIAARRKPAL